MGCIFMEDLTKRKIGQRINEALACSDTKQKDLAKYLGVTDNTVSYFVSGTRAPNIEQIIKISELLNVSTDFLLGKSTPKTPIDTEEGKLIRSICDYTGLNEEAVEWLHWLVYTVKRYEEICKDEPEALGYKMSLNKATAHIDVLNSVINSNTFHYALQFLNDYSLESKDKIKNYSDLLDDASIYNIDELQKLLDFNSVRLKYYDTERLFREIIEDICEPISSELKEIQIRFNQIKSTASLNRAVERMSLKGLDYKPQTPIDEFYDSLAKMYMEGDESGNHKKEE